MVSIRSAYSSRCKPFLIASTWYMIETGMTGPAFLGKSRFTTLQQNDDHTRLLHALQFCTYTNNSYAFVTCARG